MQNEFKEKYSDFLNAHKVTDVLEVKHEPNDTSIVGYCHQNVAHTQRNHGGTTVLGYAVYQFDKMICLEIHSIWKTKEGEYLDITPSLDTPTTTFIPLKEYDALKEVYFLHANYRIYEEENKIEMISNDMGQSIHDLDFFKGKDFSNLVFHRDHSQMETETWDDYLDDLVDERSMQCN